MLRYGKKHDGRLNDKISRSNRGRARTAATASDRRHAILGYRCGHEQRVDLRAHKKRLRLSARLRIQEDLFDLELAQSDPEFWLHGANLTRFADTCTRHHRGDPFNFEADPFSYALDAYDRYGEYLDDAWAYQDHDDDVGRGLLAAGDYESTWDWDAEDLSADPEPTEAAWRDLWVDGRVYDAEGRDTADPSADRWFDRSDDYDYDYLEEICNPLVAREEDPTPIVSIEAVDERNSERHRAGERYFKQTGRTARAPHHQVAGAAR